MLTEPTMTRLSATSDFTTVPLLNKLKVNYKQIHYMASRLHRFFRGGTRHEAIAYFMYVAYMEWVISREILL